MLSADILQFFQMISMWPAAVADQGVGVGRRGGLVCADIIIHPFTFMRRKVPVRSFIGLIRYLWERKGYNTCEHTLHLNNNELA